MDMIKLKEMYETYITKISSRERNENQIPPESVYVQIRKQPSGRMKKDHKPAR